MTHRAPSRGRPEMDLAQAAAPFAVPARVEMLLALERHEECSASELARAAGVSPATASEHLAFLVRGGLLTVEQRGRRRLYRLAGPQIRSALESLRLLAELAGRGTSV